MWRLKSIKIKNCFSIKEATYIFKEGQCMLLTGRNNDKDSGQKINGTGKSAFLESISIAITGECLRKIKNRDIVFNNEEECNLVLEMYNTKNNEQMRIDRSLYTEGSSIVDVFINDKLVLGLPKVADKNAFIINKIGISQDDLLNYFIISEEKYISFLRSGDVAKKQLINRFSKADVLDGLSDVFDKRMKQINDGVADNEKEKHGYASQKELLQQQIDELLKTDFETYKKNRIDEIHKTIGEELIVIERIKSEIEAIEEDINFVNDDIKKIDLTKFESDLKKIEQDKIASRTTYDGLKTKLTNVKTNRDDEMNIFVELKKTLNQQVIEKEAELRILNGKIIALGKQIMGKIDCPKCKHEFLLTDKTADVKKLQKDLEKLKIDQTKIETEVKDSETQITEAQEEIDKINKEIETEQKKIQEKINEHIVAANKIAERETEINKQLNEMKLKLQQYESSIKLKQQSITNKNSSIKLKEENIESLKTQVTTIKNSKDTKQDEINAKQTAQNDLDEMIDCIDIILDSLAEEKEETKKWQLYFKSFKSFLANKSIVTINSFVNHYLEKIGSNLTVQMSGYKMKGDGNLKEQISIEVLRSGVSEGDFNKFSAGEKGRVDICCILALQNLINLASESGGLEFVAIDEILDSVDVYGLTSIVDSLNLLRRSVFIVSQNEINSTRANVLIAEKTNGETKFVEK